MAGHYSGPETPSTADGALWHHKAVLSYPSAPHYLGTGGCAVSHFNPFLLFQDLLQNHCSEMRNRLLIWTRFQVPIFYYCIWTTLTFLPHSVFVSTLSAMVPYPSSLIPSFECVDTLQFLIARLRLD